MNIVPVDRKDTKPFDPHNVETDGIIMYADHVHSATFYGSVAHVFSLGALTKSHVLRSLDQRVRRT